MMRRAGLVVVVAGFGFLAAALGGARVGGVHAQEAPPAVPVTGKSLFTDKGCVHCHGADLRGTEKGPSLLGVGRKLTREQIDKQIREGGENMPPFADALDPDELRLLTDYLQRERTKVRRKKAG